AGRGRRARPQRGLRGKGQSPASAGRRKHYDRTSAPQRAGERRQSPQESAQDIPSRVLLSGRRKSVSWEVASFSFPLSLQLFEIVPADVTIRREAASAREKLENNLLYPFSRNRIRR